MVPVSEVASRKLNGLSIEGAKGGIMTTAPVLLGLDGLSFTEGDGPVVIDSDVTFTDPEGDFNGSVLTVSGTLAGDNLSVRNEGVAAGEIGFNGTTVTFGGTTIGTASGGTNGADLLITLNASASTAAVEALIENITFDAPGDNPTAGDRNISFDMADEAANALVTITDPVFSAEGGATPFGIASASTDEDEPTFVDIDNDGDMDLFIGTSTHVEFFRNNGTDGAGDAGSTTIFVAEGGATPLGISDQGSFVGPDFADIDGDGDYDLFLSYLNGTISFFENTGNASNPAFTYTTGASDPFDGSDFGTSIASAFVDIDDDGDVDLFVADAIASTIRFYTNSGTNLAPTFPAAGSPTGTDTPLSGATVTGDITPVFVDIDGDGDYDAFVGAGNGRSLFFRNTGTAASPTFVAEGGNAPFGLSDIGAYSSPVFVDIDNDGDMDAFVGSDGGVTYFFRNTQTGTSTVTVAATNDAPTATDNTITINEDASRTLTAADFNFSDLDTGDSLASVRIDTLTVTSGTFQLSGVDVSASDVIAVADINANNLVYTPAADANGNDLLTFTFSVNDGTAFAAAPSALDLDVTSINDAPTAANNTITMKEDTSRTLTAADFNFSDVDTGDSLASVRIDTLTVSSGTFQLSGVDVSASDVITVADINAGNLIYRPAADARGADLLTFTFSVNDGTVFAAAPSALDVDVTNVAEPVDDPVVAKGGSGNDTLTGGNSGDAFNGGDGNDLITGNEGDDVIWAGRGDAGNDTLDGGSGSDTIGGGGGDDFIEGGDGSDILYGGSGDDTIYATSEENQNGDLSSNAAWGGDGNDVLLGGFGSDTLGGGQGTDNIAGDLGNDLLFGGQGADTVDGGQGDDTIWAGSDDDLLSGGAGDDVFIFGATSGNDTISDFELANDTLDLQFSGAGFSVLADVQAAATDVTQGGNDGLLIDLGGGQSVFLIGLDTGDLASMNITL